MKKNRFVLEEMPNILDCLTRGLDLSILSRGYGEEGRGVMVSYQAQSPVLGAILPNNSPGVHALWLPAIPLQLGLVLKPGSQEVWTPYRMFYGLRRSRHPRRGHLPLPRRPRYGRRHPHRLPALDDLRRHRHHRTVPRQPSACRPTAPASRKSCWAMTSSTDWEQYLDLMVESIAINGGRSCINASGVWASRHTKEIAAALAERLGPVEALPPTDDTAPLAAFTIPGAAASIWGMIEKDIAETGATHMTEEYGPRLVDHERYAYLRPTILHAASPECGVAHKEYMFPFASVVECPQEQMIKQIGPTLVGTAITADPETFRQQLADATNIDRLNLGPLPTNRLNWLQPHEGNLIDFLFRSRALQLEG